MFLCFLLSCFTFLLIFCLTLSKKIGRDLCNKQDLCLYSARIFQANCNMRFISLGFRRTFQKS